MALEEMASNYTSPCRGMDEMVGEIYLFPYLQDNRKKPPFIFFDGFPNDYLANYAGVSP